MNFGEPTKNSDGVLISSDYLKLPNRLLAIDIYSYDNIKWNIGHYGSHWSETNITDVIGEHECFSFNEAVELINVQLTILRNAINNFLG